MLISYPVFCYAGRSSGMDMHNINEHGNAETYLVLELHGFILLLSFKCQKKKFILIIMICAPSYLTVLLAFLCVRIILMLISFFQIQNTETNQLIANPHFERVESMYNEGAPEFVVDQGMYYPTANYGYYCTGDTEIHLLLYANCHCFWWLLTCELLLL